MCAELDFFQKMFTESLVRVYFALETENRNIMDFKNILIYSKQHKRNVKVFII